MFQRAFRRAVLAVSFACGLSAIADARERNADAEFAEALEQQTMLAGALEDRLHRLLATTNDDRFDLYRTHNQLIGTWLQIDRLQQLLDAAMSASAGAEQDEARIELRDQAQFTLLELDEARAQIERIVASTAQSDAMDASRAVRALLSAAQDIVQSLLMDHCARNPCALP